MSPKFHQGKLFLWWNFYLISAFLIKIILVSVLFKRKVIKNEKTSFICCKLIVILEIILYDRRGLISLAVWSEVHGK